MEGPHKLRHKITKTGEENAPTRFWGSSLVPRKQFPSEEKAMTEEGTFCFCASERSGTEDISAGISRVLTFSVLCSAFLPGWEFYSVRMTNDIISHFKKFLGFLRKLRDKRFKWASYVMLLINVVRMYDNATSLSTTFGWNFSLVHCYPNLKFLPKISNLLHSTISNQYCFPDFQMLENM